MLHNQPTPSAIYQAEQPGLLFRSSDWSHADLRNINEACAEIAHEEMGLDTYPLRIEVITSEQMLDAYASVGLPLMYRHWSFGKRFAYNELFYRKGFQGLAYEIVINSDPVVCYIMEENSATMQTLVIAHAGYGHNHFFKNNYLFRGWTDAGGLLDYLGFARDYIGKCEEKYGADEVEKVLDAAHALQEHGVFRSPRNPWNPKKQAERLNEQLKHFERSFDSVLDTAGHAHRAERPEMREDLRKMRISDLLPSENLLYVIEKFAPGLPEWKCEVIRIARYLSQYFYPQKQLKVMNEGCATFTHYTIMNRLYDKGLFSSGNMLEFLTSHSNVIFQPGHKDPLYSGMNPYALGYAMMEDIRRICTGLDDRGRPCSSEQLAEDKKWFPDVAGNGDPYGTLRHAWANFRDESFILQFLSLRVGRDFRFFVVDDDRSQPELVVEAIQDEPGFKTVRKYLAQSCDLSRREPDIQAVKADLDGDRVLHLEHRVHDGVRLREKSMRAVMLYAASLWGYGVDLTAINAETGSTLKTFSQEAPKR